MVNKQNKLEHKYINMRRAIGILGISMPLILILFDQLNGLTTIRVTISNYYLSNTRDVFVGILCAISFFFISYKGYEILDNIICTLIGISALGVAFFPDIADASSNIPTLMPFMNEQLTSIIHIVSAACFFLLLAFISAILFRKKDLTKPPNKWKDKRNIIYLVCGITIAISVSLIGVCFIIGRVSSIDLDAVRPIFFLECIAILSFGVSWLTKGETIFKDR
jgi:hypothetical protein